MIVLQVVGTIVGLLVFYLVVTPSPIEPVSRRYKYCQTKMLKLDTQKNVQYSTK